MYTIHDGNTQHNIDYEFCFTQKQVVYEEICVLMGKFYHLVSYVFLLLCLCILIVMYVLLCIFCFHHADWHFSATP